MAGKDQHVVKRGKDWAILSAKSSKDTSLHNTQEAAIKKATQIAKNQGSELFIHGRDGKIRERNSFGNDPYPPKG